MILEIIWRHINLNRNRGRERKTETEGKEKEEGGRKMTHYSFSISKICGEKLSVNEEGTIGYIDKFISCVLLCQIYDYFQCCNCVI